MPITNYADGSKYGDADAFYGRITGELASAQLKKHRETGLKVSVIDEHTNDWEEVVGETTNIWVPTLYPDWPAPDSGTEIEYTNRWIRGQAAVVKLDNGNVVRIRLGSHTDPNDRQIWIQTITDVTSVSQWESWAVLYSGSHYSVAIVQTGATTYDVYHTKSDGFYINNVLKWATATDGQSLAYIVYMSPPIGQYNYVNVSGDTLNRVLYFIVVKADLNEPLGVQRYYDIYSTQDIINDQPVRDDSLNLRWYQNFISPIQRFEDKERLVFFNTMLYLQNPRATSYGSSIVVRDSLNWQLDYFNQPPILIRGMAGGAGHNWLGNAHPYRCSDGYYYNFYGEAHYDDFWNSNQTTASVMVWQRSKDLIHWSEPVIMPLTKMYGPWGMFEATVSGTTYLYLVGNGNVWRRPIVTDTLDITNYVPELDFDLPRDNQDGSGTVTVANPSGINNALKDLGDRRIKIQLGARVATGGFEFTQLDDFWLRRITKADVEEKSQLSLEVGNIWARLNTQLRDTFNIIGKTDYSDWDVGKTNQPFNYHFSGGSGAAQPDTSMLVTGGYALWTGWRGHNPDFKIQFFSYTVPVSILFRWSDAQNYYELELTNNTTLTLRRVKNGVSSDLTTFNISGHAELAAGNQRFGVYVNNQYIRPYVGNTLFSSFYLDSANPILKPGYVGFKSATQFSVVRFAFTDYEFDWRSSDLIKFAFAMADYHDVVYGGPNEKQYAVIWGPQTDLPTPAAGLRQVLEAEKSDVVWADGRLIAGQFANKTSIRTLQDEVIETNLINEVERRINLAVIDGNEHSWIEPDLDDVKIRDRQVTAYFDLPELLTKDAVKARAQEEIAHAKRGESPGGLIPLQFDLWRGDVITWIDRFGSSYVARIEGLKVEVNQGEEPRQIEELDLSLV